MSRLWWPEEIGLLRFLVQQIFEILFSLWVQAYAGYTEGFPEGMWHCRGMCTFGISKILVKEGGGMVSANSEEDLAPKKVPWRPCAKIISFNETFVLHHGNFWIQLAIYILKGSLGLPTMPAASLCGEKHTQFLPRF